MPTLKEVEVPISDVHEPAVPESAAINTDDANKLSEPSIPSTTASTAQEVEDGTAAVGKPELPESAAINTDNAKKLSEGQVPTPVSSGEPDISKSDGMETKAKDSSKPSVLGSEAPTVQEVLVPISPAAKGQKSRYKVIKVPVSKVTRMETFKPTESRFPFIDPPTATESPKKPPYKTNARREFVTLPNLSPKEQSNCAKFLASLIKKEPLIQGWWLPGKIHLDTLTRLNQTRWFNDELMDYCFKNLNSLFGGDCSPYTTFFFPCCFLERFMDEDNMIFNQGPDYEVAMRWTRNLVGSQNLMLYDHVILLANPGSMHWNLVVIYPKLKIIESVDSMKFNAGMELYATWKWFARYLQESNLPIDRNEWKLLHSRKTVTHQYDNHNCGPFSILNAICIHHQYHSNKVNLKNCKLLRRRLLAHFLEKSSVKRRLCKQWDAKYPLTLPEGDAVGNSSVNPVAVTQGSSQESPQQSSAGGDDENRDGFTFRMDDLPSREDDDTYDRLHTQLMQAESVLSPGSNRDGSLLGDLEDELDEFDETDYDLSFPDIGNERLEEGGEVDNGQSSKPAGEDKQEDNLPTDNNSGKEGQSQHRQDPKDLEAINDTPKGKEDHVGEQTGNQPNEVHGEAAKPDVCVTSEGGSEDNRKVNNAADNTTGGDKLRVGEQDDDATEDENSDLDVGPKAGKEKNQLDGDDDDDVPLAQLLGKKNNQTSNRTVPNKKSLKKDHPSKGLRARKAAIGTKLNTPAKEPRNLTPAQKRQSAAAKRKLDNERNEVSRKILKRDNKTLPTHQPKPKSSNDDTDTEEEAEEVVEEDLPLLPEEIDLDDAFSLPACYFHPPTLRKLVIYRMKKTDPGFQWPLPKLDVTEGTKDMLFDTREKQKAECVRRKKLIWKHKETRKRLRQQIWDEYHRVNAEVDAHVKALFDKHIPHDANDMPRLGKTHFNKARANLIKAYRGKNVVTASETRAKLNEEKNMTTKDRNKSRKQSAEKKEVAMIRYRPGKPGEYIATFDVKKARDNREISLISCKWVRSWLSITHYRLAMMLPEYWLHVPAGNSRKEGDLAPIELLTNVRIKYPQGKRNLCLVKSVVSALYYMDLKHESGMLDNLCHLYNDLPLPMAIKQLKNDIMKIIPQIGLSTTYNLPRCFGSRKKQQKKIQLDSIIATKTPFPTVVIPLGLDDGVNHAVCVVDDLIFDSTQPMALALSKPSFDYICSRDGCKGIYLAVRFMRGYNVKTLKREMVLHKK